MLLSRGLLFLLIYCGVLLTNQGCWARNRNNGGGDANNKDRDDSDDEFDVDDYVRRQERRNRRRKEERRQKNKEQEKASSSLIEALESHNKYTAANNPPQTLPTTYSNQTTVVQSPYVVNHNYDHPKPDDIQVGCKELRSKRYISDGFCTSVKPITELVCTGHCLPIRNLPWYAEFIKVWARTKVLEWRCVEDDIRRKKVVLQCENGETRSYRIKVVKSCKCKRYLKPQNQSMLRLNKSKSNRKRRRKTRRQNESPDYLSRMRRSGGRGRGGDL